MAETYIYVYEGKHPTHTPKFAKAQGTAFDPRIVLLAAARILEKPAKFPVTGKLTAHNDSAVKDVYFKDAAGNEFGTDIAVDGFTDEQTAAVNRSIAELQEKRAA